jgi:hypothetical protein
MKKRITHINVHRTIIIGLALIILSGCNPSGNTADKKSTGDTITVKPDPNRLIGGWLRSDGGYRLNILSVTADGKLDAGYFNPSPIHVGKAEWQMKDNKIIITVVLQDINYPGSVYTLQYFPTEDRLAGNYYQAVQQSNYNVDFIRQR